ncbi:MAG TPA: NAD-dependent epimerase/dehydratase family protein [Croceibacterium sp.]
MILAVTGSTGFVGQAVLDEASRWGVPIRALARREMDPRAGVAWQQGDLADRDALAKLVAGAEAVLHIAGVVNAPDAAGFHLGNVAGTEALLDAAEVAGVKRFVFVSSLAAREPGLSVYGRSKRDAEEAVQLGKLAWTIVRPPAIYGPRDREMLELFRAARWGMVPLPPSGRASMLHVDDLARLLLELTLPGEEPGDTAMQRTLEPDDGREGGWPHAEMAQAIGCAVGRSKVWAPHLPRALLATAARFDRLLRGKGAKLTPDRVGYMIHPDWVSRPDKAPPTGLWRAKIETRAGLADTARWYREHGWL